MPCSSAAVTPSTPDVEVRPGLRKEGLAPFKLPPASVSGGFFMVQGADGLELRFPCHGGSHPTAIRGNGASPGFKCL